MVDPAPVEVDWNTVHKYPMAEALAEQEKALGHAPGKTLSTSEVDFTAPRKYSKIGHLFRVHSWIPMFADADEIADASFDDVYNSSAVGATVMFQNDLGTSYGSVGAYMVTDPDTDNLRGGGHFKMTYTGLYPVLEASFDIGARNSYQFYRVRTEADAFAFDQIRASRTGSPYFQGELKAYIPFNFSEGGHYRGLIPQVKYSFSNDHYNKALPVLGPDGNLSDVGTVRFQGSSDDPNVSMRTLSLEVRGYVMQGVYPSASYPRFGISTEFGYRTRLGLDDLYSAGFYNYTYGYLPGITRNQGTRLTAAYQHRFTEVAPYGENTVDIAPRGYDDTHVEWYLATYAKDQLRLGIDYSIPIYLGDISFLGALLYIKNFELKPHFDYLFFSKREPKSGRVGDTGLFDGGGLFSAGCDFLVNCGNLLWLPYGVKMGVRVGYNGGSTYDEIDSMGYSIKRGYLQGVLSIDL